MTEYRTSTPTDDTDPCPEMEKIYPYSSLTGRCPGCGRRAFGSYGNSHKSTTSDGRLRVSCDRGCGRMWLAESYEDSRKKPKIGPLWTTFWLGMCAGVCAEVVLHLVWLTWRS